MTGSQPEIQLKDLSHGGISNFSKSTSAASTDGSGLKSMDSTPKCSILETQPESSGEINESKEIDALKVGKSWEDTDTDLEVGGREEVTHVPQEAPPPSNLRSWVIFMATGHCLVSCLLPISNKWALNHYPSTFMLTFIQLGVASAFMYVLKKTKVVEVDDLEWHKCMIFMPAAGMFYMTVLCGNMVIRIATVNTFIAVRSCVPFCTALLEFTVGLTPAPGLKSLAALVLMMIGAVLYVQADAALVMAGLVWIVIYLILMPIDGVLIKAILKDLNLKPWGMTFYMQFLAFCLAPFCALITGQLSDILDPANYYIIFEEETIVPVAVSCVFGIAISFFAMNTRHCISATAFMVLGVANKFLAVFFDKICFQTGLGASGTIGVLTTIGAAVLWQTSMSFKGITTQKSSVNFSEAIRKPGVQLLAVTCILLLGAVMFLPMMTVEPEDGDLPVDSLTPLAAAKPGEALLLL